MKKTNIHKKDLLNTFNHRAIPMYLCLIPFIVSIALCVPTYINQSFAWASGETIFAIIMLVLAILSMGYLTPFFYYSKKTKKTSKTVLKNIVPIKEKYAPPRTGKTSSMYLEAQIIQPILEKKLRYDYWYMKNMFTKWEKHNKTVKLQKWEIVKKTYEFYDNHNYAWCLMSSLPCTYKGKPVMKLNKRHLLQEIWAPRYTLWCIDEAGKFLPPQTFENKLIELINTFRFIGHYGIFVLLCEQRKDNILVDVRGMTSTTELINKQENFLQPKALIWIYKKLQKKCVLKINKNNKKLATFMVKFDKYINSIGFRCWTSTNSNILGRTKTKLYWTNNLSIEYDSECMCITYKADYSTAEQNTAWTSILMDKNQATNFMKSEKVKPKEQEEKEARQKDYISKLNPLLETAINDNEQLKESIQIDKVIEEINKSDFLKKSVTSTRWVNNNYDKIIAGNFRNKDNNNDTSKEQNPVISQINALLENNLKENETLNGNIETNKLLEEITKSNWLQKAISSTRWINNNYEKIVNGKYRNKEENKNLEQKIA